MEMWEGSGHCIQLNETPANFTEGDHWWHVKETLAKVEKKYSLLDKEGVVYINAICSCGEFLWGRPFMILTDHKPLVSLFGEYMCIAQIAYINTTPYKLGTRT